jgi:hypothetical protein
MVMIRNDAMKSQNFKYFARCCYTCKSYSKNQFVGKYGGTAGKGAKKCTIGNFTLTGKSAFMKDRQQVVSAKSCSCDLWELGIYDTSHDM